MKGLTLQGSRNWAVSFGVYVIVILALLRLLIYPLHAAIKERRAELVDQRERNKIKMRVLEQARQGPKENISDDTRMMSAALYPRETSISKVQTDVVATVKELSESKGMSVTGFEMPEAVMGKKITVIPVVIRMKGRAEALFEVMKMIKKREKLLMVKAMDISAAGPELTVSLTMKVLRWET